MYLLEHNLARLVDPRQLHHLQVLGDCTRRGTTQYPFALKLSRVDAGFRARTSVVRRETKGAAPQDREHTQLGVISVYGAGRRPAESTSLTRLAKSCCGSLNTTSS